MAEEKKNELNGEVKKWVDRAKLEDITYHRTRQQLWGKLCELVKKGYKMDKKLFQSVKSALTTRSQDMDDNKKLAFDTALDQIEEQLEEDADADDDDEGDDDAGFHPKAEEPKRA